MKKVVNFAKTLILLTLIFIVVNFIKDYTFKVEANFSDGTEDAAFYTNLGTGFDNSVLTTSIQSDGDILIGGEFNYFNGNTRTGLVRLNSDGTEDTTFYTNLGTGFGGIVRTISIQSDGDIIVGGDFSSFNDNIRFRLVRLNSDGTEDTDFYTNLGMVLVAQS